MPNPLDNFEIVEVEQGKLEPKMILAENFYFKYGEKALRVGTELNLQSAFRLNSLTDHQEISRMEGKDKGDPIKVFKRINGAEKGWIESMRSNLLVRETILEEIIKRYREEGITVIREVSEITKPLIKEVLAGQINSRDMILKRTEKHKLLEDLLGSAQFKNRIEEFILKPLSQKPIIGTYLSYAPDTANHCLDINTLTIRLAFELGLPEERIYDLSIAAILHDIGLDYLKQAFKEKEKQEQMYIYHSIHFVERILSIGEEKTPIDGLTSEQIQIMKHHHTRRDGLGPKEPTKDKRGIVYIGKDISYKLDTPELLMKSSQWKSQEHSKNIKLPYIMECPVDHNEILYLAEEWITGIERSEANKLEAAGLLKSIEEESGICARKNYVEPLLKIIEKSYFNH